MSRAAAWPYPRVLAHRGGGALAPENTIAAIRVGSSAGIAALSSTRCWLSMTCRC